MKPQGYLQLIKNLLELNDFDLIYKIIQSPKFNTYLAQSQNRRLIHQIINQLNLRNFGNAQICIECEYYPESDLSLIYSNRLYINIQADQKNNEIYRNQQREDENF